MHRPTLLALALSIFALLAAPLAAQPVPAEFGSWCHHGPPTAPGAAAQEAHAHSGHGEAAAVDESAEADDEDGEEKEEEWDVQNPPLTTKTVTIDVTEGTWMNLDVSPDGEWIVFDLFGDLYLLPAEGGEATALTQGLAWDMQPRFSPDGSQISFTSDRKGGDNIFVMDLPAGDESANESEGDEAEDDGPRQITKEDFRLLNNAVWSPDGRFLAARKHFTSRRSLGAGEIWLYHASGEGSSGLQLNDKPNDQKDLGEPAFSPDGRYVYYSRDATPGGTFQYSKDPNGEIYRIYRIDLETGETEPFVTGAGGAVRPTPSPDGKQLAFVRRLDYKTTLYVKDLETGSERPLYDGLDRDLQETWAIHGVYANFAWTPDSESIVFWAGGGLHRLDLATGTLEGIPFHVRQEHQLVDPVRFANDPAPASFHTKALRWVQVSPDGTQVVFQALGKLWLRSLPDGEPRRLTSQTDHDEYHPSWSRDGKSIVYVSWDDVELGAVRRASVGGAPAAEGKVLTKEPGHYVEPALSPDGKTLVYRKTGGGFVTSPLYSSDTGLYALSLSSGTEPDLLTEDGVDPHFGASSDRVFYLGFAEENRRELHSIDLDGRDDRTHASTEAATIFRVSPDGEWLAWTERFAARIVPFVEAVKPLQLGTSVASLPSATVSKDAGNFLHWSGDSQTLHWSLGPELFSRELTSSFDYLDGAPEELPEPPEDGIDIGFDVDADAREGVVALVGGRVVTFKGGGDEVIEDGVVVLDGDRIVAVGARADIEVPAGARIVDTTGHTVLPGFIDVHWHGSQGTGDGIVPERNWFHDASAAFGVTTVHDPSSDTHTFFAASELQRAGERVAPRLFSTGTILYGAAGSFKAIINSADDARSHLRRLKALGAFSVKSYNQPRRDQRQQVIQAAHELEMLVMPEGGSLFMHNMSQVVDGHTGIEHAIPLARLYDDVVQIWSQTEVAYTPTLGVAYGGLWGENYWYAKTDVWDNERLLSFVPKQFVAPAARRSVKVPEVEYNHIRIAEMCKKLSDAGVDVNLGAHGQREGLAAHWEMWMLEQGGMTPTEALRSGTWNGAMYLGMQDHIGSIEEGKLADLVVVEGNPLEDLRQTENVTYTVLGGRVYDASTMTEVGDDAASREPYWFAVGDVPLVVAEDVQMSAQ